MYRKVVEYTDRSFGEKRPHFGRTVYWLKKLKPDADEPMLIAAYSHDISRAFPDGKKLVDKAEDFTDKEFLAQHQEKSMQIMKKFLEKNKYGKEETEKACKMISLHETGGDPDSDLIKDADSISFFETNASGFVKHFQKTVAREKIAKKIKWMYSRITSDMAKEIARPMYIGAMEKLGRNSN